MNHPDLYCSKCAKYLSCKPNFNRHLVKVHLTAEMDTITNLDIILSKCSQLQKLSLAIHGWEGALDWDQQRIERNTNLKMLSIQEGFCPAEMLEYLLYKYPSIKCASVNAKIDDRFGGEYVIQVPRLVRRVPHRKLIYSLSEGAYIRFDLNCLISIGCKITLKPNVFNLIRFEVDY